MNAPSFLESAIKRFKEYKSLAERTFVQLDNKDLFYSPNVDVNSIAIIIQHMHGNMMSRWTNFLTEDGEKEWRQRDEEFEPAIINRNDLLTVWEGGWQTLFNALESLTENDLQKTVTIRSHPLTVTDAILRQLAHYSYHVGQIVYIGKSIKGGEWQSLSIPKKRKGD
jgi:hypothetical protein